MNGVGCRATARIMGVGLTAKGAMTALPCRQELE
ncbi:IS1-like element transposase [Shigella sonnei]